MQNKFTTSEKDIRTMKECSVIMASDHAGFWLKQHVKDYLTKQAGFVVEDVGCFSSESCDYPDFAHLLATKMATEHWDLGLVFCSTGNGITMTVNKHQHIRAALCWNDEIAAFARKHNDANVIGIPANYVSQKQALSIVQIAIDTEFEGGRHLNRVNKIPVG